MADARFDFSTNINDVRRQVVTGLDQLVSEMQAAGSRLGSVGFGNQLVAGFQEKMAALRAEVRRTLEELQGELRAGTITPQQFSSHAGQVVRTGLSQAQQVAGSLDPRVIAQHGNDLNRALIELSRTVQQDARDLGGMGRAMTSISNIARNFEARLSRGDAVTPTGPTRLVYRGESAEATPALDPGRGRNLAGRFFTEDIVEAKEYAGELGRIVALELSVEEIEKARRAAVRASAVGSHGGGLVVTPEQAQRSGVFTGEPTPLGAATAEEPIRRRWATVLAENTAAAEGATEDVRAAGRHARNLADAENRLETTIDEAVAAVAANRRSMAGGEERVLGPRRIGGGENAPFFLGLDDENKEIFARVVRIKEQYDKEGDLIQEADQYLARIVDEERVDALTAARVKSIRQELLTALEASARAVKQQATEDARSARQAETAARQAQQDASVARQRSLGNVVGQGLRGEDPAFKALSSGFVQVPTDVASSGFVKRTQVGYEEISSIRDLGEAERALARSLKQEQATRFRQGGPDGERVGPSVAIMSGLFGRGFNPAEVMPNMGQAVDNMLHTVSSQVRYAVGGIAIYEVTRGLADLKQEYLDYVDSLTDFNVALGVGVHEGQNYVQTLEQLSRLSGSNVGEALDTAARGVRAFGDAGNAAAKEANEAIGVQMVNAATQLSVIASKDLKDAAGDVISIANAFEISGENLTQVTDAIAAAKQLGGDPAQISQGLSSWGQAASAAGFNVKEAAAAISIVIARTDETGSAAATRLSRISGIFGTGGNQAFLRGLGVDVTQSVEQQIAALSRVYNSASSSEQAMIRSRLGGTANLRELLPLLDAENQKLLQHARNADVSGKGQREFDRKTQDLAGTLRKFSGDLKNIEVNLVNTGIFDPLIVGMKALEPLLHVFGDFLGMWDRLAGLIPAPLRALVATVVELGLLLKLIQAIKSAGGVGAVASAGVQRVREVGNPALAAQNAATRESTATDAAAREAAATAATASAARTAAEEDLTQNVKRSAIRRVFTEEVGTLSVGAAARAAATNIVAAGVELGTAIRTAGLREKLGGLGSQIAEFANSLAGMVTIGIIGAEQVLYAYGAGNRINKALAQGNKALAEGDVNSTATGDDIAKAADDLRTAADNLRESSSGFWGTIVNGLRGDPTGTAARDDEQRASELDALRKRVEKIRIDAAHSATDASSAIDVTTPDGITNGLKLLADSGRSATTQFNALIEALDRLGTSADGAMRRLSPGESQLFSVNLGDRVRRELNYEIDQAEASVGATRQTADTFVSPLRKIGNMFLPGAPFKSTEQERSDALRHVDRGQLAKDVENATNQFMQAGGDVSDPRDREMLRKILVAKIADDIKDVPKKYRDEIKKFLPQDILNSLRPLLNVDDPTADLDTLLREGIPRAQQSAAESGLTANLGSDSRGAGLSEAQSYLDNLQRLRANAIAHGAKAEQLEAINTELQRAQIALNDALSSHIGVMGKLSESLTSPFDKAGRLQVQLQTLQAQLAVTTEADARRGLEASIADTQNQIAQQQVTDANASRSAAAQTGNKTADAYVAWQNAYAQYKLVASSTHTGADLNNAAKATNDAQFAYLMKATEDANSIRLSQIDPRANITRARSELQGLNAVLALTTDPGDRARLIDQIHSKVQEILRMEVDKAHAIRVAAIDPRNAVGNALEDLRYAEAQLGLQLRGTQAYAEAARRVADQRQAVAHAEVELANAFFGARTFPGSQVDAARLALQQAKDNLGDDKRGTTEWYQDLAAFHQAQAAYADSVREAQDTAFRLGIDITDPVATAMADLRKARQKLTADSRAGAPRDVIAKDTLDVRTAENAAERAAFDQRLQDMQTADQLGRISHQAYLQYLQHEHDRLTAVQHRTRQQQDELNQIDQALQASTQAINGQFNLGDIKLPSIYEVRRSIAQGAAASQVVDASTTNNNVTINGVDMTAVITYLNSILGPNATGSRAPASNRKA